MSPEPQYFSVLDAARYCGLTTDAIRARIKKNELPATRVGARVFIDRAALDNLMHARLVASTK